MIHKYPENVISITAIAAPKQDIYSIKNGSETIYVYDACIIRLLSQALRVPFKILLNSDGDVGVNLPDGNWTGGMGMVHRSEADIGSCMRLDYLRFQAVNFSYPYRFTDRTFMTDKLKPDPTNLAILHPFPLTLWILLIVTLFIFSCVLYLYMRRQETYQNILFMLFGSLLEKSMDMQLPKLKVKLIISTWLIFIFIIINSYKAVLLSILTLPPLNGIRNIPDLAKAAEEYSVSCYCYKASKNVYLKLFSESEFVTWRSVAKCLQRNVINAEDAEAAFIEAPPNKAFITDRAYLRPYEEMYFISEDSFAITMIGLSVSKTFCCRSSLDEKIHRLFAAGLFQKIDEDEQFILKLKKKTSDLNEPGGLKILKLEDLKGAFIILFSGYVLSTIVLFIEILVKHHLNQ